jgi:hemoglobin
MEDITTRTQVEFLVDRFYEEIVRDNLIGFFFTDIAKIDLSKHLPKMYNFWESILLGNPVYEGNPMRVHFPLNEVAALEERHFNRWLQVWEKTVHDHFEGPTAETAVTRALNIARIMSYKMTNARSLE